MCEAPVAPERRRHPHLQQARDVPVQVIPAPVARPPRIMRCAQVLADLQPPPRKPHPRADIEVFPIHEEPLLVEPADLPIHAAAKQHEQARNPGGDRGRTIAGPLTGQYLHRRDDRPVRLGLGLAGFDDARRQQAGVRRGHGDQRCQHVAVEADVGVQHQEPRRGAVAKGLVVVGAEAQGLGVLDALDGKTPCHAGQQIGLWDVDGHHDLGDFGVAVNVELRQQGHDEAELPMADDRYREVLGRGRGRGHRHGLISAGNSRFLPRLP